jgi:superfamily II DNA/RNA helicase
MSNRSLDSSKATLPSEVSPARQRAIHQRVITVDAARRTQLLRHLIEQGGWPQVLVFVATKYAAEIVADKLRKAGLSAEPLHNQLSQGKRTQVLLDFKAGRLRVVVATEAAVRGLALPPLPVLVNYDLPRSVLDYGDRLGRVAPDGWALNLVNVDTEAHFSLIEKRQNLSLPRENEAGFEPLTSASVEVGTDVSAVEPLAGGIKGKRPNKKDKLRCAASQGQ